MFRFGKQEYQVINSDGENVTDRIFILDPDSDIAARSALNTYATSIEDKNPWLSYEIRDLLFNINCK